MKINTTDIKKFNGVLLHSEITPASVSSENEVLSGDITPILFRSTTGLKDILVRILFRGSDRKVVETNISGLTALLLDECVLNINNRPFLYHVTMYGFKQNDMHPAGTFTEVSYNLSGYACMTRKKEDFNQSLSTQWKVKGNIPSAATLTITPTMTIQSVAITGFSEMPITIRNLKKDVPITLDGEKGLIMENGQNKFKDVDLWEFPRLIPGTQSFGCSHTGLNISIEYNPRFL